MTTSPLKVEDSQAQFEAWCKTVMSDDSDFCMEWGDYINLNVRLRWEAWKAASRAIVVELPEPYDDGHGNLWLPQDATAHGIRAAGIAVKGD